MKNISREKRFASFRTAIAYVDHNVELTTEGVVEGLIIDVTKGIDGFGYDPVFYYPPLCKTLAEMSLEEKGTISHRGRALGKLYKVLKKEFEV